MKRFVLADGAKEEINKIFEKARVTKKEVAELLNISPNVLYQKNGRQPLIVQCVGSQNAFRRLP